MTHISTNQMKLCEKTTDVNRDTANMVSITQKVFGSPRELILALLQFARYE